MTDAAIARRPQRLTLDVLGMYAREPGTLLWSRGVVELLGDLGFSVGASRIAVQRLVARGLLERRYQGRRVRLRLSRRGETLLREGDERIFGFGRAPVRAGCWTAVWHLLPPSRHRDRQQLATRLRFGGFGQVRDGLWVAAGDRSSLVASALGDLRLQDQVGVLVGRPAGAFDPARIWDQPSLLAAYRSFTSAVPPRATLAALSDRDAFRRRAELMHAYQRFTRIDPELPEFVSVGEARVEAVALFDDRYRRLAEPATRHVQAALAGGGASIEGQGT